MDTDNISPPIAPRGAAHLFLRVLKLLGWVLAWIVALGCVAWSFGALHYDFPVVKSVVAWLFLLALIAALVFLRGPGKTRSHVRRIHPRPRMVVDTQA